MLEARSKCIVLCIASASDVFIFSLSHLEPDQSCRISFVLSLFISVEFVSDLAPTVMFQDLYR